MPRAQILANSNPNFVSSTNNISAVVLKTIVEVTYIMMDEKLTTEIQNFRRYWKILARTLKFN